MHVFSKLQKFLFASFSILILSVSAASAEPAPLTVRNETGQDITLTVLWTHSCTQGTHETAALQIGANSSTVWQLGRNSAVSGCTGQVCVEIAPANQFYQDDICFNIYGGYPIGNIGHMQRWEYFNYGREAYPNFQIRSADQNRGENVLIIGPTN
ncbi:hypothetical protein [Nioella ostreopsis]|uniref:hypothetical protein n=1 Tax=Nioella ostreopsis TaxID=2448479 RepID=UPI000FD80D5F|nr:hypothetical protein [Nioella ostreopsis]